MQMRVRIALPSISPSLFLPSLAPTSVSLSFPFPLLIAACGIEVEYEFVACAFLFISCALAGSLAHWNVLISFNLPVGRVDETGAGAGTEAVRSGRESESRGPPHNVRMQVFSTAHDPHSNSILQSPALLPAIGLVLLIFLIAFFFQRLLGCVRAVDKKKKVAHIV